MFDVLNCIIMYVKHYINGRRNKNKSFLFIELLGLMKDKVKILVQIEENDNPVITDRARSKWPFTNCVWFETVLFIIFLPMTNPFMHAFYLHLFLYFV